MEAADSNEVDVQGGSINYFAVKAQQAHVEPDFWNIIFYYDFLDEIA